MDDKIREIINRIKIAIDVEFTVSFEIKNQFEECLFVMTFPPKNDKGGDAFYEKYIIEYEQKIIEYAYHKWNPKEGTEKRPLSEYMCEIVSAREISSP